MTAPAEFETLLCHVRIVKKRAERQITGSSLVDIRDQFFPLLTWKWRENTSDVKSVDDLRGGIGVELESDFIDSWGHLDPFC